MMLKWIKNNWLELAVIVSSFLLFSTRFYPALNSDDALAVLMLHDFSIPDAIYCWGQDRGGSLVPLLGQFFYSLLGLSSIWAESITHHLILVIGYFSFATTLKTKYSKVALAVVWFLPPLYFIGFVRYSWGILYSLIGVIIWLVNYYSKNINLNMIQRIFVLIFLVLISVIAVWVLDQAVIILALIASFTFYKNYKDEKSIRSIFFSLEFLIMAFGSLFAGVVIYYLKSLAITTEYYNYDNVIFNSVELFFNSILIVISSIYKVLSFNNLNILFSIYTHLCIYTLIYSFIKLKMRDIKLADKQWIVFYLILIFVLFSTVLSSNWAYKNEVARRYFSGIYFIGWLSYLLYIDHFLVDNKSRILKGLLIVTLIVGSLSTLYQYKYISPKRLISKYEIVKEFEKLGKVGLISEYWNSYGSSFFNPDLIKATPHDQSAIRNWNYVDDVLAQPKIYFIRDMWLDSFPNSINQFGIDFTKVGDEFYIGDCFINEYKREQINRIYNSKEMIISGQVHSHESDIVFADNSEYLNTHIVYGPFINLPKGDFRVSFYLQVENVKSDEAFAIIDVACNAGKDIIVEKSSKTKGKKSNHGVLQFHLDFTTDDYYRNIEFRIFYLGGANLIFKKVSIVEIK